MSNIFFISDTHFGHSKILTFETNGRQKYFTSIEEHDEKLIDNWNNVVRNRDTVIHLGDVAFNNFYHLHRLKGYKRLILGNHDKFERLKDYFNTFHGAFKFGKNIICTHIPVHPKQIEFRFEYNFHGHVHTNTLEDKRYINLSADVINFIPVAWEELKQKL